MPNNLHNYHLNSGRGSSYSRHRQRAVCLMARNGALTNLWRSFRLLLRIYYPHLTSGPVVLLYKLWKNLWLNLCAEIKLIKFIINYFGVIDHTRHMLLKVLNVKKENDAPVIKRYWLKRKKILKSTWKSEARVKDFKCLTVMTWNKKICSFLKHWNIVISIYNNSIFPIILYTRDVLL